MFGSVEYQFRLIKYDVDNNGVAFDSNIIKTPSTTLPKKISFTNLMVKWLDQGPNSGDNQIVEITIPSFVIGVISVQVIVVSGEGAKPSTPMTLSGIYLNKGVSDNQTVSYQLRAIDFNGKYIDSDIASVVIGNRTGIQGPVII